MKKSNLQRQVYRNLAAMRIQAPSSQDWAWRQYGVPLTKHPMEEWRLRLEQDVPSIYQATVRNRLIREYGEGLAL